jgi:Holliday junction resolvase RusA-like endonuclease
MRVIRGRALHSTSTLEHRSYIALAIAEAWAGKEPLDMPLDVAVLLSFQRPKNHYRTGKRAHELKDDAPLHHAVPLDVDKGLRLLLDGGTMAGLWQDDGQVTRVRATKVWASSPSTRIMVWPALEGW